MIEHGFIEKRVSLLIFGDDSWIGNERDILSAFDVSFFRQCRIDVID